MSSKVYFRKVSKENMWSVRREKNRASTVIATVRPESMKDPRIPMIEAQGASDEEIALIRQEWSRIGNRLWNVSLKLLIVCEGETEVTYWKEFVNFLGLKNRVDVQKGKSTNPHVEWKCLFTEFLYRKAVGNQIYRTIWLVFDRDAHPNFKKLREEMGKVDGVHLAVTNPCFEYWFLLHYEQFEDELSCERRSLLSTECSEKRQGQIVTVNKVERYEITSDPMECLELLKSYWPRYQKGKCDYLDWLGGCTKRAYDRARAKGSPFDGHGSTIPNLIDALCEMAGITPENCLKRLFESMSEKSTVIMPQMEHLSTIVSQARNNPKFTLNQKGLKRCLREIEELRIAMNAHFGPESKKQRPSSGQ